LEAVIPFENIHRLVSADPHDGQVINPCSPHVRQRRVAEIVEPEPNNLRSSASCVEGGLDGLKGLPPYQEDVWLLQIPDFIQGQEESRQLRSERDEPPFLRLRVLSLQPDQPLFEINTVPHQIENFATPHAALVRHEVDGL